MGKKIGTKDEETVKARRVLSVGMLRDSDGPAPVRCTMAWLIGRLGHGVKERRENVHVTKGNWGYPMAPGYSAPRLRYHFSVLRTLSTEHIGLLPLTKPDSC